MTRDLGQLEIVHSDRERQVEIGFWYVKKRMGDLQFWLRSKDFHPTDRTYIEARIKGRLEDQRWPT